MKENQTMMDKILEFFFRKEEILDHWYEPLDHFQFSTNEFYGMVEKALEERKVPGMEITRIDLNEGGLLSMKREYLQMRRERLLFHICAAPFGTSYFFSGRFVQLPLTIKPMELFVFFVAVGIIFGLLTKLMGFVLGVITVFLLFALAMYVGRNAIRLGLKDLDTKLLKTPVIAPLYEMFLRKETYFREDTRRMYVTTVNTIVKKLVDDVTAAKGVKLVKRYERKPIMGELYEEKMLLPPELPKLEAVA